MHNKTVHKIAFILVIIGGINWLTIGAFNTDLVTEVLSALGAATAAKYVFILVGLAAVYELLTHKR